MQQWHEVQCSKANSRHAHVTSCIQQIASVNVLTVWQIGSSKNKFQNWVCRSGFNFSCAGSSVNAPPLPSAALKDGWWNIDHQRIKVLILPLCPCHIPAAKCMVYDQHCAMACRAPCSHTSSPDHPHRTKATSCVTPDDLAPGVMPASPPTNIPLTFHALA